ncbi:MAG TPA: family 1 glycosylhydrolase [Chthoniobacterales bacterium]|nr:family 1 glycosylhydrolase [Chthoniobacterales bacterium]
MDTEMEKSLQLWGGVECTVNRVGDRFFNQLERNGHWDRAGDLDRFAALGLRTLRFPLLWETLAPDSVDEIDWSWPDDRLARARALGIRPIAGLLHHGSGPVGTNLLDPKFPEKFARYAGAIARRYPWIDGYTPVNEPLTTARFSALYGHWYPHAQDDGSFARALLNQGRATVLAMRAIRQVNPEAQLIQTDDLAKTFSSPSLSYQAAFENERRWIAWDLLSGVVDRAHPLWSYFKWTGVSDSELETFLREPCPPDVIGANYYVTSERFLDDNFSAHPAQCRGGNGRDVYADIAAVRSEFSEIAGPKNLLMEVWERYGTPIAITEAHLGCTADEQLRWFMQIWDAANEARSAGADIRAVTIWSLLGSFDWDSLVTRDEGHYEAGVFDVYDGEPRETLLGKMMRELTARGTFDHPCLATPGWWEREERLEQVA